MRGPKLGDGGVPGGAGLLCGGGVEAELIGYFSATGGVGARGLKLNAGQVSTEMQGRRRSRTHGAALASPKPAAARTHQWGGAQMGAYITPLHTSTRIRTQAKEIKNYTAAFP